jgi:prevent-host-death family protein
MYVSYATTMAEPANEMSMSDVRDHLADVVNRAVYSGTVTYVTRRGRRLAALVPAEMVEATRARLREEAVADAARSLWQAVVEADAGTRETVRRLIDHQLALAEDDADVSAVDASAAMADAGAVPVPWETVRRELGL